MLTVRRTSCARLLQGRALSELRALEESSAAVASAIQEGQLAKRALLDDLMEAERQIMLAERKIQLEKEMQVGRALLCTDALHMLHGYLCAMIVVTAFRTVLCGDSPSNEQIDVRLQALVVCINAGDA